MSLLHEPLVLFASSASSLAWIQYSAGCNLSVCACKKNRQAPPLLCSVFLPCPLFGGGCFFLEFYHLPRQISSGRLPTFVQSSLP